MFGDQRKLAGLEEAFEQQNGCLDACRAQLQGLLDAGHGKTVGLGLERQGAPHRAMTVGVGLDHGQGLGAGQLTGEAVVVSEGLEVDQGTGGTHGGSLLAVLVIDKASARQMGVGTHRAGVREQVNRFQGSSWGKSHRRTTMRPTASNAYWCAGAGCPCLAVSRLLP